jgi:hypothetical protein
MTWYRGFTAAPVDLDVIDLVRGQAGGARNSRPRPQPSAGARNGLYQTVKIPLRTSSEYDEARDHGGADEKDSSFHF